MAGIRLGTRPIRWIILTRTRTARLRLSSGTRRVSHLGARRGRQRHTRPRRKRRRPRRISDAERRHGVSRAAPASLCRMPMATAPWIAWSTPTATASRIDFDPTPGDGVSGVRLFEDRQAHGIDDLRPNSPHGNTISLAQRRHDLQPSPPNRQPARPPRHGDQHPPTTEWVADLDWIWASSKREEDYADRSGRGRSPQCAVRVASSQINAGTRSAPAWLDSDEEPARSCQRRRAPRRSGSEYRA